jgi:hypothetical protein
MKSFTTNNLPHFSTSVPTHNKSHELVVCHGIWCCGAVSRNAEQNQQLLAEYIHT